MPWTLKFLRTVSLRQVSSKQADIPTINIAPAWNLYFPTQGLLLVTPALV